MSAARSVPEYASGDSAATGKPHYYGRLYWDAPECIWCGQPRAHAWHIDNVVNVMREV